MTIKINFPPLVSWSVPKEHNERFKYYEIGAAYGYLLVESLTDKDLQILLDEIKAFIDNKSCGPNLTMIQNMIGTHTYFRWILGTVIETLYVRDIIDEIDQSYLRKHCKL